jgi:hypothetical protein
MLKINSVTDRTTIENELLVIGCSHTAGVGHASNETAYPTLFSKMLGIDNPMILGLPGQGNMTIELKLTELSLQNKSVVIQFSDFFRLHVYDSKLDRIVKKQSRLYTYDDAEFYTENYLQYEFIKIVNRLVTRFRDSNVDFLFFRLSHMHENYHQVEKELDKFPEYCSMERAVVDFASDGMHYGINIHQELSNRLYNKWTTLYAQN